MENPEAIQQVWHMMQNPSLMRETMEKADRVLGQLDVMSGGHRALLQAHEEYAESPPALPSPAGRP